MKKIFLILLTLTMVFALAACGGGGAAGSGDGHDKGGKNYSFPVSDFIPAGIEYTGSGEYVFTDPDPSSELEQRFRSTYIAGSTLEDTKAYVDKLKEKGYTYAAYGDEELELTDYGTMSWYGVNGDKTSSVYLTFFTEDQEVADVLYQTGVYSYNLQIQLNDSDIFN